MHLGVKTNIKALKLEQRLSVITIAAADLEGMKSFYEKVLGWSVLTANEDIVFFKLNGFLLSICDRKILADFIGIGHVGEGLRAVTIGYNVAGKEEVLKLYDQLNGKVNILKEPVEAPFGGVFFYFTDIEGNIIEVAYNPFVTLDDRMNAVDHLSIRHL